MTQDEITRMAQEAGFVGFDGKNKTLANFAALVAAHEREECAKLCEELYEEDEWVSIGEAFAAIRARGEQA